MSKKGFTLTEMVVGAFILSLFAVLIYSAINQIGTFATNTRNRMEIGQELDTITSMMFRDISSMSMVMTPQKNLVPYKATFNSGDERITNQTLKFYGTVTYEGSTYSYNTSEFPKETEQWIDEDGDGVKDIGEVELLEIGTLQKDKYDVYFDSVGDIPRDGISFSIGIPDDVYSSGVGGDNSIRSNYFLQYRDDDADGKTLVDGEFEDPERDGFDDDGDGLDGEDPAIDGAIAGYHVTYFLVPSDGKWYEQNDHRYQKFQLVRRLHKPHNGDTETRVLSERIVMLSILPFKTVKDQRIYLSPEDLDISQDSDGEFDYSNIDSFNVAFEITIVGVTNEGRMVTFQRIFRPQLFNVSGG
ncbi:MAG TPA: prepilin-type N-terminal cleavage/methylation domain-containing protein [Candidatus Mcinerneyibacterium sp.]|nr:prepilin-type N-terminal cleavage/methylation domain-containing protein [Candidatus Mcinerneyibacterium sp.]